MGFRNELLNKEEIRVFFLIIRICKFSGVKVQKLADFSKWF